MVSMAEQRRGAEHLEAEHGVSERRACQVIGIWRREKIGSIGGVSAASEKSHDVDQARTGRFQDVAAAHEQCAARLDPGCAMPRCSSKRTGG